MNVTAPVLAEEEIAEARAEAGRMVGLEAAEPFDPARHFACHGFVGRTARRPQVQLFYLATEILAEVATPTSFTVTSLFDEAALNWWSFSREAPDITTFETGLGKVVSLAQADLVFGYNHQRTSVTRELRAASRAVEGDLSFEDLFDEVASQLAERLANKHRSDAFQAFVELKTWLKLNTAEAAELVGVKRTTPHAWAREGRKPQPSNARRLSQLHSIVKALVRALGEDEATRWLEAGDPSARELLLSGDVEAAAKSAEELLIGHEPLAGPAPGSLIEERAEHVVVPAASVRQRGYRKRRAEGS
jgi:hypothetical protein